ncbi:MAG: hypothetical protein Q9187_004960 [Circinaria calcarea]
MGSAQSHWQLAHGLGMLQYGYDNGQEESVDALIMVLRFTRFAPRSGARRTLFFLALTSGLGGLQGVFSVQIALGSPYLMSLGFSKPLMALVWIAGPLAGVIGQPYFGLCSDQCRISMGKRRPFILAGAFVIICSLLALAWVKETVETMACIYGAGIESNTVQAAILTAAALFVWVLNFSIQPLQCGFRALIIDSCAPEEVEVANAWASRMIGIGSLLGYGSSFLDLPRLLHSTTAARFQKLSAFASCGLAVTVCLCCALIDEQNPNENEPLEEDLKSTISKFKHIYARLFQLHPQVMMVFKVQFYSWVGWFSFMYYITTYINEIYMQNSHFTALAPNYYQPKAIQESANRQGSLALFIFAFVQLLTSIIAPIVISAIKPITPIHSTSCRLRSNYFHDPWTSLRTLWILSHAIFAICMLSTFLVNSVTAAIVLVGTLGISAALTQLVPFSLLSIVLSRNHINDNFNQPITPHAEKSLLRYDSQPGIVMGLHNVAIAAPQLLAALGSSAIFWLLGRTEEESSAGRGRSKEGGDNASSTGWVLRAGGIVALMAIYMATKLSEAAGKGGAYELVGGNSESEFEDA